MHVRSTEALYDETIIVRREEIRLRLTVSLKRGFVMERHLRQADSTTITLLVPLASEADLYDFATADGYYNDLRSRYEVILDKFKAHSHQ
jgi:hypothetical protein